MLCNNTMKTHSPADNPHHQPSQSPSLPRPSPIHIPHLQHHDSIIITQSLSAASESHPQQQSQSSIHKPSSHKLQQLISLFKINDIHSKNYRLVIEDIAHSFTNLDSLTNHLQLKVDHMLKLQQNQFIQSYKTHMKKIQQEFASVDKKIEEFQKKIAYYQNQGQMSQLFIKVNQLQNQCKKLYKDLELKEKINKDHVLTIKVQKSQLKRYEKQLKALLREKNELHFKLKELKDENKNEEPRVNQFDPKNTLEFNQNSERQKIQPTLLQLNSMNSSECLMFPTQLELRPKNDKSPNDLSTEYLFGSNQSKSRQRIPIKNSLKSLTLDLSSEKNSPISNLGVPLLTKVREMQLKKQLNSLKKRNQMLNSFQSYVLEAKTDMQSFFLECVNEIKQQIKIKKKINFCTFEEWRKEDKIQLLIKIVSNDEILAYLYQRIFKKKRLFDPNTSKQTLVQETNKKNVPQKESDKIYQQRRFEDETIDKTKRADKDKSSEQTKQDTHQKVLSMAKRRFSKHISENSLLPKIQFHLEY